MRLTHLKLAGFKSFVDPTTLHIHGQRVGVVGPNGCGKSNVMESVRWVLGESSAKEMRADAMDAVIFNGSGNRKPISRASVELVFDNSLGGASGEWSQYAEISVKRVIERGFVFLDVHEEPHGQADAKPGSWEHFCSIVPPWLCISATLRPDMLKEYRGIR